MNMDKIKYPSLMALLIAIFIMVGLDQFSKQYVVSVLDLGQRHEVLPVFGWTLLYNKGAAFSFLSDAGGWQRWFFMGVSILVSMAFLVWLFRLPKTAWLTRYSLTFIIAGALGNLVDRIFLGYVVDFISVHWEHHYFPAFNLADSAITLGAMLMILDILINPENHK